MIVAGCDVGSLTAKAVVIKNREILTSCVIRCRANPEQSAQEVMNEALSRINLSMNDVEYCIGTGYGRKKIPFVKEVMSEIACHGMAVKWLMPSVNTVIDVGGQDAKAIRINGKGEVDRFAYNDKCASGTGRFFEIMASALEMDLDMLGDISLQSKNPVNISNQCTVFAETEVISHINNGNEPADIIKGLHRAMAHRVASLARSIEANEDVAMSGGVAKNSGMYAALEDVLEMRFVKNESDPQINGALGAALFAARKMGSEIIAG